jgi:flagellin-like protein
MKGQQAIGTLVIFIALVITAALATYVIMAATNQAGSKASAVSTQTVNGITTGMQAIEVKGYAVNDGKIADMYVKVKLAPGSSTIDMKDVKIEYSANGGLYHAVYDYNGSNSSADLNAFYNDTTVQNDKFYILTTYSKSSDNDDYLASGEAYALGFKLPTGKEIAEGMDWKLTIGASYTSTLKVAGVAPDVIQGGQVVDLD